MSILGPKSFLVYIKDLLDYDGVICNIAIYADDTTLYFKYDPTSDLWQQLQLTSELESHPKGDCELRQEVTLSFLCWKNSTVFIQLI